MKIESDSAPTAMSVQKKKPNVEIGNQNGLYHVGKNCEFFKFCKKNALTLPEPLWYAKEIAYDRWGASLIRQNLERARFKMFDFGQGYSSMSPASKELMRLVIERIAHGGHRVLRWNFDNIKVKQDIQGNINSSALSLLLT